MSYVKKQWNEGDLIDSASLNNIENGIEDLEGRVTELELPGTETTSSIPLHIETLYGGSGVYHDLGQLKAYYSDRYYISPGDEPYILITNESTGIVEPRGVFDIYLLPTSSGSADDMSFSPKYCWESGTLKILDSSSFSFEGLELFLEVLSRRIESNAYQKFSCNLTYSSETGIYSGSGEVMSTCYYTCSFDPKTLTCEVSFSSYHTMFEGYEVFSVDIMPKNKSYIPSGYKSFIPLGSNKKHFIYGDLFSSELICENTYKTPE